LPVNPPAIVTQPQDQSVVPGGSASFCVSASGSAPLSYIWRQNGSPILGATNACYQTNNVPLAASGSLFSCLVSNTLGSVTSSVAKLTVIKQGLVVGMSAGSATYGPAESNALYSTLAQLGCTVQIITNGQWDGLDVALSYPGGTRGFGPTLSEISSGVNYIQIGDWGGHWTSTTAGSFGAGPLTIQVDAVHPITSGLPASWSSLGYWHYALSGSYLAWSFDTSLPSLASEVGVAHQTRVLVAQQLGLGRAVFIGWNVYGSDASTNDVALLRNALHWAAGATPPAAPPTLAPSALRHFPDGSFQFSLGGTPGYQYSVLVSTNLQTWSTLATFILTNSTITLLDTNANLPRRFYRARLQ
jgi:hypothetical protein